MLSHDRIWAAIDQLAARHAMTPSGLARRAGLDPTTFNRSKRVAADGRPRWPSTESIAKILEATGAGLDDFLALVRVGGLAEEVRPYLQPRPPMLVPVIGWAQAGAGGFFDDGGFPIGVGWDEVPFPGPGSEPVYALKVAGTSMEPLYRDGDVVIVAPAAALRAGDRVVVQTREGEVMAKTLLRRTETAVELASINPEHGDRTIPLAEIERMGRIVWASQ